MALQNKLVNKFLGIFEGLTGYVGQISSDHAYIHKGQGFVVPLLTGSLSSGATYKIAFTTPSAESGKYVHWRPSGGGGFSVGTSIETFEGSTSVSGGTDLTPLNKNRNIPVASIMQSFKGGVTVGADGTRIQILSSGSAGSGSANQGGSGASSLELVLKPDTVYTVTITNRSASTATLVGLELWWYEEVGYTGE